MGQYRGVILEGLSSNGSIKNDRLDHSDLQVIHKRPNSTYRKVVLVSNPSDRLTEVWNNITLIVSRNLGLSGLKIRVETVTGRHFGTRSMG